MRTLSAAEALHPDRRNPRRNYPAPETFAGAIYHRLATAKGRPVFIGDIEGSKRTRHPTNAIASLTDFYGLDIRRVRNGWYILAGEWFGFHYSDYVNMAIDAAVAAKAAA